MYRSCVSDNFVRGKLKRFGCCIVVWACDECMGMHFYRLRAVGALRGNERPRGCEPVGRMLTTGATVEFYSHTSDFFKFFVAKL